MDAARKTCLGKTKVNIETGHEPREAESRADLKEVDTMGLEANREKLKAIAEQREVPQKEAPVEMIGALEDRYGDRHLAVGRRRQPKKWTQGDGGSQKMAAAHRRMTHHTVRASRKGNARHRPGKNDVVRETPKGWTFEKRCWKRPKYNTVIRDRGLRQELPLGSKETFYEVLG
jgi:hypothetical protein